MLQKLTILFCMAAPLLVACPGNKTKGNSSGTLFNRSPVKLLGGLEGGHYGSPGIINGNLLYLGTTVTDISNPANPRVLGTAPRLPRGGGSMCLRDSLLYFTLGPPGLYIIDVSEPQSITIRGHYSGLVHANGIDIQGTYAYVADRTRCTLEILDISDPSNPVHVGSCIKIPIPEEVSVSGSIACVALGMGSDGFMTIDISNPKSPRILSHYRTRGFATFIKLLGTTAYVAHWGCEMEIVDLSNPGDPKKISSYSIPENPLGMVFAGNLVFISHAGTKYARQGFHAVDISNPAKPRLRFKCEPGGIVLAATESLLIVGDSPYDAAGGEPKRHGLSILSYK